MENIKGALLHDVKAARELLKCHEAMEYCGYRDNPFWDNFAIIANGIYCLIGENTGSFEDSITNLVLMTPYLSDERRVEMLYAEYNKNFPAQPRPVTSETDSKKRTGYTFEKSLPDGYDNSASVTRSRPGDLITKT